MWKFCARQLGKYKVFHQLACQQVKCGDAYEREHDVPWQRHEAENFSECGVGKSDCGGGDQECGDCKDATGLATKKRAVGAYHHHDEELGHE